jgi:hypothetical protein
MLRDLQSEQGVLWHAGEALAEGSLSDCIKCWDGLPRFPRSHAYIQVSGPIGEKNVLLPRDLCGLAARELYEGQH